MVYLSLLSVAMIVALLIQMIIEYLAYSYWPQLHARGSYFSVPMLMDYISSFMLSTLCMIGGNDDCAPERMDDRKPTCFTDGKGTCTF